MLAVALVASMFAQHGLAQVNEEETSLAKDLIGRLDLDVPDSPAFAILGITPQNVINPDTPAELAAAILIGDDQDGNSQEGLAIEFRPFLLAMQDDITIAKYRQYRLLSRAAISFADANGSSDEDPTDRQAIGLTLTPIDEKDPFVWADLGACTGVASDEANKQGQPLRRAVAQAAIKLRAAQQADDAAQIAVAEQEARTANAQLDNWLANGKKEFLDEANKKCLEKQRDATTNGTQWQIGVGYHDSEVGDLEASGVSVWTSYARQVPRVGGSLIVHARTNRDRIVPRPDEPSAFDVVDQDIVALRYRRGSDRQGLLLEASYVDESTTNGGVDDDYTTALIGAEFRIGEGLWVQIGYGDTFGSNQNKSAGLTGQFRWAASKSRLWN